MTREQFIKYFGDTPEDILGNDWEDYIEDYLDEVRKEETCIDK